MFPTRVLRLSKVAPLTLAVITLIAVAGGRAVASVPSKVSGAVSLPVLGQAYRRSNDLAKTGPQLLHAIELRPDNYDAHYVLGMVLAAPGRTEEAITQMATAEKLNPHAPGAHYKLSVLYKDMTLDIRRNWKRLCA